MLPQSMNILVRLKVKYMSDLQLEGESLTETNRREMNKQEDDLYQLNGAPGEIRTPDHLVRSQILYPAELRAHRGREL